MSIIFLCPLLYISNNSIGNTSTAILPIRRTTSVVLPKGWGWGVVTSVVCHLVFKDTTLNGRYSFNCVRPRINRSNFQDRCRAIVVWNAMAFMSLWYDGGNHF